MCDWDLLRNTSGVRVLTRLAEERGMPAADCLAGTGLPTTALVDPSAEITAGQELTVMRALLARFGREPGLGVAAGALDHVCLHGPWGLSLIGSRSPRDAVDVALRYVDLSFVGGGLSFEESEGEARLRFDGDEVPADVRSFLVERVMTGVLLLGRELFTTGVPVRRIGFRHRRPADTTRYRDILGIEPTFDHPVDEIAFDSACLDSAPPRANEWARSTCEQLCRELLSRRQARTGVAGAVRDLLVRDPAEIPDQTAVAAQLYMSQRTLSRRLHEEGTSFRALLDEVRQTLSEELLDHTDMTTEQVAARLGYAEAASFIRAFRRWKGCPPQEYRARGPRAAARTPALV
ncbi:AraC family transcriptional regulator [Nocardia otitidiscaviarum]|uniref:AraC family transcriptional regulator n=1 Tax=Nocardia otitidiscaviarum TaxID=1823 RepID=UPI0018958B49|nr:AraC family transcriptional regulator [Nocardia otitidiscaviarum]MBF6237253.1 AraC family transcriptional regulator [Nocardia otitidiscaviarum]